MLQEALAFVEDELQIIVHNLSDTALVLKLDFFFLYDHGLRSQIRCCETHRKSCLLHLKSVSKVNTNIVLIALRCLTELCFEIAK